MKRIIIIFIVLVVAIGLGIYFYSSRLSTTEVKDTTAASSTPTIITYKNTEYGYSVEHSSNYEAHESTPEVVSLGTIIDDFFSGVVDVRVEKAERGVLYPVTVSNFNDFAYFRARNYCINDGRTFSVECTGISRVESFLTNAGVEGQRVYLNQETTLFDDETQLTSKSMKEVGPVYIFNISSSNPENVYTTLAIYNPLLSEGLTDTEVGLSAAIAKSLKIQ